MNITTHDDDDDNSIDNWSLSNTPLITEEYPLWHWQIFQSIGEALISF